MYGEKAVTEVQVEGKLGGKRRGVAHSELPSKHKRVSKDEGVLFLNDGGWCPTPPITMSCLIWNYHGLGNPCTVNELAELVQVKDPSVMLLAETWADEARLKEVMRKIQCENMFIYPRTSRGGGSMFFWGSTIDVTIEISGTNYIDALFQEDDRARIGLIIRDCQGRAWHRVEIIPLPLTVMEFETLATSRAL